MNVSQQKRELLHLIFLTKNAVKREELLMLTCRHRVFDCIELGVLLTCGLIKQPIEKESVAKLLAPHIIDPENARKILYFFISRETSGVRARIIGAVESTRGRGFCC